MLGIVDGVVVRAELCGAVWRGGKVGAAAEGVGVLFAEAGGVREDGFCCCLWHWVCLHGFEAFLWRSRGQLFIAVVAKEKDSVGNSLVAQGMSKTT